MLPVTQFLTEEDKWLNQHISETEMPHIPGEYIVGYMVTFLDGETVPMSNEDVDEMFFKNDDHFGFSEKTLFELFDIESMRAAIDLKLIRGDIRKFESIILSNIAA